MESPHPSHLSWWRSHNTGKSLKCKLQLKTKEFTVSQLPLFDKECSCICLYSGLLVICCTSLLRIPTSMWFASFDVTAKNALPLHQKLHFTLLCSPSHINSISECPKILLIFYIIDVRKDSFIWD